MRKGRQIDRSWDMRKYKGDGAIYAYCKCGFYYPCYKINKNENCFEVIIDPNKIYHYCPYCGKPIITFSKKYYEE